MILEDEQDIGLEPWRPPSDEVTIPVEIEMQPNNVNEIIAIMLSRTLTLRSGTAHERLKANWLNILCLILHNMIIKDEQDIGLESWRPPSDEVTIPVEVEMQPNNVEEIIAMLSRTLP
ncbi:hypothetical protein FRX31_032205 [Thalictrum thalictroides]|uniref:Uncharacterized protein n=1 Tax=Thalictrum thalictroides TaxID=46969 RepID=A0A7J6V0H0_THATH|nr:hypothetical protein FRX31_032205 [Thalictrum thalictroides]